MHSQSKIFAHSKTFTSHPKSVIFIKLVIFIYHTKHKFSSVTLTLV